MPAGREAVSCREIALFLNRTLRVPAIRDASVNGLQVRLRRDRVIGTVGFAVDACLTTFQKARKLNVDLLVVHHGIKWRPQKDRETAARRQRFLEEHNIALYAAHLPLDLHRQYGNNAELCRLLDLGNIRKFGRYHGIKIGYQGTFPHKRRAADIARRLDQALATRCRVYDFGAEKLSSIGVISGGGGSMLLDAVKEGLDGFLVGEMDLAVYNAAKEYGITVIAAGHYATETVGVKALMPLVADRFGTRTLFVDDPKDL